VSLTRAERAVLRERFTEVETAVSLATAAAEDFRAALDALDQRILADVRRPVTVPRPARPVVVEGGQPPVKHFRSGIKRARRKHEVNGGNHGAVAESMRRAVVTEIADFLRERPGVYRPGKYQVSALGGLLRMLGPRYGVRNVSADTRALWQYRGVVQELQA
jgi:hypothetical protein